MEKERKIKILSIIALLVAILGLTVAFAALSESLTINGTASLDAATWDVHFENISGPTITGDATEVSAPEITDNGITLSKINVNLTKPKDSVKYTVDVVNDGTINAEIVNIVKGELTAEQEKAIEFSVTNEDGTNLEEGFILNAKAKQKLVVTIRYKDDIEASDLLADQSIDLSLTLNYVQTDSKNETDGSEGGTTGDEAKSWNLSDTVKMTYYNGELQSDGTYINGDLVISGTGPMPSLSEDKMEDAIFFKLADVSSVDEIKTDETGRNPILKYNPDKIIVEEGITEIGYGSFVYVFANSVQLPNSLVEIGDGAFQQMPITSITIPDNVTVIGNGTFSETNLTSIVIPRSVKKIENSAFFGCNQLKEIYIPKNVTEIGIGETFHQIASDATIYLEDESTKELLKQCSDTGCNVDLTTTITVEPSKFN